MAATAATDVVMPQMGVSVSEGTITKWLKQEGEQVAADEPLLEISTDKVDTEVPSPGEGIVQQILVQEGETVDVGTKLAVIAPAGAEAPAPEAPAPEAPEPPPEPPPAPPPEPAAEEPTPPPRELRPRVERTRPARSGPASSPRRPSRPRGRGSAGARRSRGSEPRCRPCPWRSRAATRRRRFPHPPA